VQTKLKKSHILSQKKNARKKFNFPKKNARKIQFPKKIAKRKSAKQSPADDSEGADKVHRNQPVPHHEIEGMILYDKLGDFLFRLKHFHFL
jgi:hypothetical protein